MVDGAGRKANAAKSVLFFARSYHPVFWLSMVPVDDVVSYPVLRPPALNLLRFILVSFHFVWFRLVLGCLVSIHLVLFCFVSLRFVLYPCLFFSFGFVWFCLVFGFVSFHLVSFRFASFRLVWFWTVSCLFALFFVLLCSLPFRCVRWQPPAVSVSGARFAIEAQRAKHEAARRRLQALEDENRALRRSKAENQVCFRVSNSRRALLLKSPSFCRGGVTLGVRNRRENVGQFSVKAFET